MYIQREQMYLLFSSFVHEFSYFLFQMNKLIFRDIDSLSVIDNMYDNSPLILPAGPAYGAAGDGGNRAGR